ncbi:hypothetical protein IC235_18360 [Hymenobacter sp. BT664]|uniref:Adhesin domain-containing protein n=1 Tax=Hymenobacter montanus TaxID=2771359 RepID=A0A927GKS1_9BACT|nr:hypothetical protein [Hymenobacter montanus]MBD2769857.1 hypothetical protein [Hymenobacter montanus]
MRRFLFLLLLVLAASGSQRASAQKIIEKTANLAAGQRLYLNLRQASSIRVRAGASGKMTLKASVSINQNKLNEALLLTVEQSGDELRMVSAFDKEVLRNSQPGDCPNGGSYYGDTFIIDGKNDGGRKDGWSANQVCAVIDYEITVPAEVALRVNTLSGNIDIAGLTGPIEAKSLSGFVDVAWPATRGAELSLKSITGEVYTDQEIAFTNLREKNPIVGYQLHGTLSGSGPLVKLESISNDVYFRKRK